MNDDCEYDDGYGVVVLETVVILLYDVSVLGRPLDQ